MKYFKPFGVILAIVVIGAGAVITAESIKTNRQEASVFAISKTAETNSLAANSNPAPDQSGIPGGHITPPSGLHLCQINDHSVTVTSPTLNQVYVSGQTITVNWWDCGILPTAVGTLTLTKISGTGPTFASVHVTANQSSYTTPIIAALAGTFDGTDSSIESGTYVATVTYGTVAGSSSDFQIQTTKTGLKIDNGSGLVNSSSSAENNGHDVYFEVDIPFTAIGHDIYLSHTVKYNVPISTLGGQIVTFSEYLNDNAYGVSNPEPFDAQVIGTPTLTPITPGITLSSNGTYKIPVGTEAQFKLTAQLRAPASAVSPYVRYVQMTWNNFEFATSDASANISEPVYEINIDGSTANFNF